MALVILLLVCGWISINNAQPNTVSLLPQDQSVCRGESISYNCIGSGTEMELFSPPIVNESNPLRLFSIENVQTCRVMPNSAAVIVLVDSASFMGAFTLYISDQQSEGQLPVICRVTSADGMEVTTNETTLSVLGAPSPVTNFRNRTLNCSYENITQVPVNISWDSPANAQEFMLQITGENIDYNTIVRSLESSVTVQLPYGTYSATLCAINRCGQECRVYPITVERRQQRPDSKESNNTDSSNSVIAPAVVAGILGLFFILTFIYAVVLTVIFCTSKKDKLSAQAIPADEMKMK